MHYGTRRARWIDYSAPAAYFVTICTHNFVPYFGKVRRLGRVELTHAGKIAQGCWESIPEHFPYVWLDEFIVMPNHVHGVVVIEAVPSQPCSDVACNVATERTGLRAPLPGTIATVLRSYKAAVSKIVRESGSAFRWQPRFADRVIRNEREFNRIREYIQQNPTRWLMARGPE